MADCKTEAGNVQDELEHLLVRECKEIVKRPQGWACQRGQEPTERLPNNQS